MNNFLILLGFSALSSFGLSQANYEVLNLGDSYSSAQIEQAIQNADLCGFYYTNNRRLLPFDDGALIELFKEDETQGISSTCFIVKAVNVNDYDSTWEITDAGHLVRRIAIKPTK